MEQRVLVVDDDGDMQAMMDALLTGAGYRVSTAGTFHSALHALTYDAPDLLITDVRLGGYNGLQLIATSPVPVPAIAVTGFADGYIEAEARRMGAEYLLKPVSPAALLDAVQAKLASPPAASAYAVPRRWMRKPVSGELPACVGDAPARLLDVSYGGVRFEIERVAGRWLPLSFDVEVPASRLAVGVDVVWKTRSGESRWLCGARVSDDRPQWREFVDGVG